MSLKFLDKHIVGAIIVDAFQQELNTEKDPADGQWFTNGPSNNGGLYGNLADALASALVFLPNEVVLTPRKLAAATATVDNRNGLTPKQTVTLTYSTTDTATTSHTTTNALKQGLSVTIKASGKFMGVGLEVSTQVSTEYSYSWSDTKTESKAETKQFSQSVPTDVPAGKVYQVVLTCDKTDLKAPYHADIIITGKATANFASPVNGQKTWAIDAGTLCEWINKYGSAGDESSMYMRDPANPTQGLIRMNGQLTSAVTANFSVNTYDVTDTYNATGKPPIETNQTFAGNELDKLGQKLNSKKIGN
ncbi:ETX/MTX2 family pore-forming toxin [Fibrella aquatilis]|uniref:ETX/MTX2 family pore-forming toxin n=1 Tax=Fibrella aquatilis TaxID=2817059 RepID=A0A939G906_9BACT|nr:ETX/MTX2 family pore-forming toxin [Fibrella aquatilis]MBO0932286.1 ETX/MTX2 family pore-forming toxin [Fibrella aquatilis]